MTEEMQYICPESQKQVCDDIVSDVVASIIIEHPEQFEFADTDKYEFMNTTSIVMSYDTYPDIVDMNGPLMTTIQMGVLASLINTREFATFDVDTPVNVRKIMGELIGATHMDADGIYTDDSAFATAVNTFFVRQIQSIFEESDDLYDAVSADKLLTLVECYNTLAVVYMVSSTFEETYLGVPDMILSALRVYVDAYDSIIQNCTPIANDVSATRWQLFILRDQLASILNVYRGCGAE